MNRHEREQALWHDAYMLAMSQGDSHGDADEAATIAAESFRKRYPVEPAAPLVIWYDEPPCPKDGSVSPAWLFDYPLPILVAYFDGWMYEVPGVSNRWHHLAGRRVSPITKPPEPTT